MTASLDRAIGIGGIVIGLVGTGIVVLWPNKRWLGTVFVGLGFAIAFVAIAWAVSRSKKRDPDEAKILELQTRLANLQSLSPKLQLAFDNGSDTCLIQQPAEPPLEFSSIDMERFKEKYPKLWQPPLDPRSLTNAFHEMAIMRLSDYQIEKYNDQLDEFFRQYEDYMNRRYGIDESKSRSICLNLELRNSGTSPATDVSVLLKLPTSFAIACDPKLFSYPKAPKPPKKPQPNETLRISDVVVRPYMPTWNSDAFLTPKPDDLRWLGETENSNHKVATFEIPKLNHGFAKPFPKPLIITFNDRDSMRSFSIEFEIHASNLPTMLTGQLHVVISNQ
jgi:hypothetical protein